MCMRKLRSRSGQRRRTRVRRSRSTAPGRTGGCRPRRCDCRRARSTDPRRRRRAGTARLDVVELDVVDEHAPVAPFDPVAWNCRDPEREDEIARVTVRLNPPIRTHRGVDHDDLALLGITKDMCRPSAMARPSHAGIVGSMLACASVLTGTSSSAKSSTTSPIATKTAIASARVIQRITRCYPSRDRSRGPDVFFLHAERDCGVV